MTNSLSHQVPHNVGAALDDVTRAAEALRRHAAAGARNLVQKAAHEVQEHPVASLAAAITAAAALVGVIAANRHKDT